MNSSKFWGARVGRATEEETNWFNAHASNLWAERSAAAATTTKEHARLGVQRAWASSLLNLVPVKIYVRGGATVVVPDLDRIEQQHHYHAALLNM